MGIRWEVYEDQEGAWRWRALAGNGKIVADSAEGYKTKRNAERALGGFQVAVREPPPASPGGQLVGRCSCAKPELSKSVTNLCTGCGKLRG